MASVNKVMILGRLGKDPEVREAGGSTVANLAVATSRRYKGKDGEKKEETEWHQIQLWGKQAELAEKYLKKGNEVWVEGRLHTREYVDKDGVKRWKTSIVGEQMQFAGGKNDSGSSASASPKPTPTQSHQRYDQVEDF